MVVGATDCVPAVALVPLQPPEAVHVVAFVLDQVSVEAAPEVMDVGEAERVMVGAGVDGGGDVLAPVNPICAQETGGPLVMWRLSS